MTSEYMNRSQPELGHAGDIRGDSTADLHREGQITDLRLGNIQNAPSEVSKSAQNSHRTRVSFDIANTKPVNFYT